MKKFFLFLFFFLLIQNAYCQKYISEKVDNQNSSNIVQIAFLLKDETQVDIDFMSSVREYDWISLSPKTTLSYVDPKTNQTVSYKLTKVEFYGRDIKSGMGIPYPIGKKIGKSWFINNYASTSAMLTFDGAVPEEVKRITISENSRKGFKWEGIHVNERKANVPSYSQNPDLPIIGKKDQIDQLIQNSSNPLCGYYEQIVDQRYKLAFVEKNDSCFLVYMGSEMPMSNWKEGETKAILRPSTISGLYMIDWYLSSKAKTPGTLIIDNGILKINLTERDEELTLIPMGNSTHSSGVQNSGHKWSGTGFALKNGYIVTNYHVSDKAKNIEILGVNGDFSISYKAVVVGNDKVNDLSLLKIQDEKFGGFETIPYSVKTSLSDVGEDIFVLGYPLTSTMGEEIKLTNGIISSKSGYDGDVALYQMSAPIQPGNSGGPMFDSQGNLIGIVCAHHGNAENVSYAIKTSYLHNLVASVADLKILPSSNSISKFNLKDQVKQVRNFVFYIKCCN